MWQVFLQAHHVFTLNFKFIVFVNIYYEFNNELLDFVFSQQSNLKCVLYADVHTAVEKTDFGGQQSEPLPAGLTYIQDSSGFAANTLVEPDVPAGYEFIFGPSDGANSAPGVSFHLISSYLHLATSLSIWVLFSWTNMMSLPVPSSATVNQQILTVVLVNTSTSGALWSTESPLPTHVAWSVVILTIIQRNIQI
jgi:hypothetical protein